MECKRVALVFQGTVNIDARVRREVQSISQFSKIDVFCTDLNSDDSSFFNQNVKLIQFQIKDSWLNRNLFFYKKFISIMDFVNPLEYDAVICIDYPTLKIGVEFKKKNPKLILIYDSHEIYIETINQFFPTNGLKALYGIPLILINKTYHSILEKKLVNDVDISVTVCDSLKIHFEKKWKNKILVLRNCPDLISLDILPVKSNPYIEKYGCNENDKILLYQGDINPGRGLSYMIESMSTLPSHYKLFIVGSGMLKNNLINLANKLLLKNVFFVDRLPYNELFNYTRYAHLGISLIEPINLSKKLSLPNKLFEYMYCGVPFLSSDLPEPKNLLRYADVGYICSDFKFENIGHTIEEIFSNEEQYQRTCTNAKNAILNRLNWVEEFNSVLIDIKKEFNKF